MPTADLVARAGGGAGARDNRHAWLDARGADGRETPAASFALVRLFGDEIEIARLGDCLVLLESDRRRGQGAGASGAGADRGGDQARDARNCARPGSRTRKQILRTMMPQLRAQRRRRNIARWVWRPGSGAELCADDPRGSHCRRGSLRRVLLASDGYYRLVDHYDARNDAELVRDTERNGRRRIAETTARYRRRGSVGRGLSAAQDMR